MLSDIDTILVKVILILTLTALYSESPTVPLHSKKPGGYLLILHLSSHAKKIAKKQKEKYNLFIDWTDSLDHP